MAIESTNTETDLIVRVSDAALAKILEILAEEEEPESLGLRIVRAMAQQLGGKFEMAREGDWTVCRLSYAPKRD